MLAILMTLEKSFWVSIMSFEESKFEEIEEDLKELTSTDEESKSLERPTPEKDYFEWIGDGYGILYFEYPERPTSVMFKNVLDMKIRRKQDGTREMTLNGKILLRMVPRRSVEYPPEPAWVTAIRTEKGELPNKTMFGYLVVPIPSFLKFKTSDMTEGLEMIKPGIFKLVVNKSVLEILKENKVVFEIPYEIDFDALRETLRKHELIQMERIDVDSLVRSNILSLSWLVLDFSEEAFKQGLMIQLQRVRTLAEQGSLSPAQFIASISDVKESSSKLAEYMILVVSIKNETLGSLFQSMIDIEKIELMFPGIEFGVDDIIVPENMRGVVNIKSSEGIIELSGFKLELNQELSFALVLKQSVLAKMIGAKEIPKIRIIGKLIDVSREVWLPDIVTGIVSRTKQKQAYGIVYFTPMGYPVNIRNNKAIVPSEILEYPFPGTKTEIRIHFEQDLPIEVRLKEPVQKEISLSKTEYSMVIRSLKRILESLGFVMLYDSDARTIRFAKPWDQTVILEYILYKGSIEGVPVVLFIEAYGITKSVEISLHGEGAGSSSAVSGTELLSDIKIIIRSNVPPSIIPKLMSLFDELKDKLENAGRG